MIRRFLDGLYTFAGYVAGVFLIVIFGLMLCLALGREVGFNIPAGDDFAAWSMAALAFLGLAYTFKSGEVIRVGLVLDRLHGRARRAVELGCLLVATGLVGYFAWYALSMTYDSYRFNDMAQGVLAVPLWIPQLGYSLGLAILAIAFADEVVRVLSGRPPSYEKPPPTTPEEVIERAIESGV
jgi:TRAP-type C4-dicarboxylate transport system permease small subunit